MQPDFFNEKHVKKVLILILKIILGVLLFSILWVVFYKFVPVPATILILQKRAQAIENNERLKYTWVEYEAVNSNVPLAFIASEDQKFIDHNGFDYEAIEKAMAYNEKKKYKKVRGASTISQQVAKNVFLWPQRSWIRKGLEVYFTFLIELIWGKKRILEVYINVAQMGKSTFGIQEASFKYFKKDASKISASEAATIAAILPNPERYNASNPGPYVKKRRDWIIRQMSNVGGTDILKSID